MHLGQGKNAFEGVLRDLGARHDSRGASDPTGFRCARRRHTGLHRQSYGTVLTEKAKRAHYANLTSNLPDEKTFKGAENIAVSRTDHVRVAASGDNDAWMDPVIASKLNAALFSDKESRSGRTTRNRARTSATPTSTTPDSGA
jgi:hypothetical protein